ncbi:spermidine/putrescine transport system substrate-binding protein [Ciceribacter lividus]|uniref:Spermidine/putrescine transport system substrate-binding protein n=1 Tax=Ciceribacter lividus TaxID=1197950 RepID=A0A6I7HRD3_9HYPH|nr:spermidine/putrescine ABC transporter substrate-binding protein [Ciceribacter lividus]RCW28304.1 spermidine/putrescine transport system substrate-binding protein [Ciceribacter lividus]
MSTNADDRSLAGRFRDEFLRWKNGSVTRRHFLGVTGLGLAAAMLGGTPTLPGRASAADLGRRVSLATWPNYHDPASFEAFTAATGVEVDVRAYGSNEDMYAAISSGAYACDLCVPTNYAIPNYMARGLLDEIELGRVRNFDASATDTRLASAGTVNGRIYALPKNWGTTGFAINSGRIGSAVTRWKDFFDLAQTDASGRTIIHDYQLTAVGNALVALGYSFNSVDPQELEKAEELLIRVKPHLYAIDSDYQAPMRSEDAWLSMCWVSDAAQLHRDLPEVEYVIGADGGELWCDFYAIPTAAPHKAAGYALLNFLLDPAVAVREHIANGAPTTDSRVLALLPEEVTSNRIVYPEKAALSPLEFGAAVTMFDARRNDVMERFRAA